MSPLHLTILNISFLVLTVCSVGGCGPGRGAGSRRRPHKLTPLVYKQHVPNVSENTLGASGPPSKEGKIKRSDKRFHELVTNYNYNIVFKDEEKSMADRIMSLRCRDKLDYLATSVTNHWPGVKLRVTESWDEDGHHASDSLHYEGRAVDITTSDRDRSKYGMLARLAVEAGFDWVYYESRGHIHCSVKSDQSAAIRNGGCFPSKSFAINQHGPLLISDLKVGDTILIVTPSGNLKYSRVLLFLDRASDEVGLYYNIETRSGRTLTLTPAHLVFVKINKGQSSYVDSLDELESTHTQIPTANQDSAYPETSSVSYTTKFAKDVTVGDYVYALNHDRSSLMPDEVIRISTSVERGLYAPLTEEGVIIIDDVLTSCYAVINSQTVAHWTFAPIRWFYNIFPLHKELDESYKINSKDELISNISTSGIHWYAKILYSFTPFLPEGTLFSSTEAGERQTL